MMYQVLMEYASYFGLKITWQDRSWALWNSQGDKSNREGPCNGIFFCLEDTGGEMVGRHGVNI